MTGRRCELAGLGLVTLLACARGEPPTPGWTGGEEIRNAREAQNEAIGAHELDDVVRYWAADVVVTVSSGAVITGNEEYREALAVVMERFPDVIYVRTPNTIKPSSVPDLALEQGTWVGQWTDTGRPVRIEGSYLAMWRREDGRWLIRSELFVALQCEGCENPA